MNGTRPAGGPAPDRSAAAVVHYFSSDPLRTAQADRIARDLGLALSSIQPVLDHLVALGVLDRKTTGEGNPPVYASHVADQFLDVIERLASYFTRELEDLAGGAAVRSTTIPPAQLLTPDAPGVRSVRPVGAPVGEAQAHLHTLHARIASLEAANALLQRKNLELSFLYEASLLLASSIDLSTLGQTVVNAIVHTSRFKVRRCFVALADGDAFLFHAGHGVEPLEAEQFMFRYRARLRQCVQRGEVIVADAETLQGEANGDRGTRIIIPMVSQPPEPAYGCIVITDAEESGLTGDDVRTLTQLAELAGRSLANATLYSRSITLGMTDALTGVLNRRYLDRRLADEVKRARRMGTNVSAIIADLDHFKTVNDRYGHLEGDRLLQAVAKVIASSVRDIDVVTRFGGEEFALILPGANERDAYQVAERVRRAVQEMSFVTAAGVQLGVTISCGVAHLKDNIHTPGQLIGLADRRLLAAKRTGRNRTIASDSGVPVTAP